MGMTKAEARQVLGGTNGAFTKWEEWKPAVRADVWRQLGLDQKHAFWALYADQLEYLPELPPEPEPDEQEGEVFIDIQMAFAIAKQYGLDRDTVLAAIALGEIKGIDPQPGLKALPRAPYVAWLDDQGQVEYGEPVVLGEVEIEGQMIKVIDSDEVRDFDPVPASTADRLEHLNIYFALAVIALGVGFIIAVFANL